MGKFYGPIGYGIQHEDKPGVFKYEIKERNYFGDVLQFIRKAESGENLNDDININNKISIVADPFAYENFRTMLYVLWMGVKWKVTNVEMQHPRLILTIGGVYNGSQDSITDGS